MTRHTRRQFLAASGLAGVAVTSGCLRFVRSNVGGSTATPTEGESGAPTPNRVRDADDDGVVNTEDYAPWDPDVQEKSDLTGSEPTAGTATPTTATGAQSGRGLTITERADTALRRYPVVAGPLDLDADPSAVQVVNTARDEPVPTGVRQGEDGIEVAFKVDLEAGERTTDFALAVGDAPAQIPWEAARYNLYDGFEDGELAGWEIQKGEWRESDGTVKTDSTSGNRLVREFEQPLDGTEWPLYWETRAVSRNTGAGTDIRRAYLRTENDATRIFFMRTYQNNDDGVGLNIGYDSPDSKKLLTADQFAVGDWIRMRAWLKPDGTVEAAAVNEANEETGEHVYSGIATYAYTRLMLTCYGGHPGSEWDYVKLRYRVDPEPEVTVAE